MAERAQPQLQDEQRTVHTTEAEYLATLEALDRLRAERDRYREALERIASWDCKKYDARGMRAIAREVLDDCT